MTPEDGAVAALVATLVRGGAAAPAPAARVRAHGLAPLAYRHGLAEFRSDYIVSSLRAEQQRAIASQAVAALAAERIPAMLLKGISYAGWLYADPAERPMSDVDLLVPPGSFARATSALAVLGYRHVGPGQQRSRRHHAMTLKRSNASVDLHRSPAQIGRIAVDFAGLWSRAQPAAWVPGAQRPELVDEVLLHVANLVRHDLIAPLISYVDAGRMLLALDDAARRELLARAARWRFRRVLAAALEWVEIVVGARPPDGRWWFPSLAEVLRGELPARRRQVVRKLCLVEGPRELAAYVVAVADGYLAARRAR